MVMVFTYLCILIIWGGQLLVVISSRAAIYLPLKLHACLQVSAGDAEHLFLLRLWFFW